MPCALGCQEQRVGEPFVTIHQNAHSINSAGPRWARFHTIIELKVSHTMRSSTSLWAMLLAVSISAAGVMAQTKQPLTSTGVPAAGGGNAANVLPNVPSGAARVENQTRVTTSVLGGGLLPSEIGIKIGRRFDCSHVIDLLIRRAQLVHFGRKAIVPNFEHFDGFHGGHVIAKPVLGDLILETVGLVADGTADTAPIYAVTIRNNGKFDVPLFHVSAVAVLGEIHEFSPTTTVRIPKLCAGETVTVKVHLPFAAMAMGNANHRSPFDTLVVAIDAFDAFVECDELNNILVVKRMEVRVVETKVETTIERPVANERPSSIDSSVVPPTRPSDKKPSLLEEIDLDKLDLPEADGTAMRLFR